MKLVILVPIVIAQMTFISPAKDSLWIAGIPQHVSMSVSSDLQSVDLQLYEDGSGKLRIFPDRKVGTSTHVNITDSTVSLDLEIPPFDVYSNDQLYYLAAVSKNGSRLRSDLFHVNSAVSGQEYFYGPVRQLVSPQEYDSFKVGQKLNITMMTSTDVARNVSLAICWQGLDVDHGEDDFKISNSTIILDPYEVPSGNNSVQILWDIPIYQQGGFTYAVCFYEKIRSHKKLIYRGARINFEWPIINASPYGDLNTTQQDAPPSNSRGKFLQSTLSKSRK